MKFVLNINRHLSEINKLCMARVEIYAFSSDFKISNNKKDERNKKICIKCTKRRTKTTKIIEYCERGEKNLLQTKK